MLVDIKVNNSTQLIMHHNELNHAQASKKVEHEKPIMHRHDEEGKQRVSKPRIIMNNNLSLLLAKVFFFWNQGAGDNNIWNNDYYSRFRCYLQYILIQ